MAAVQAIYNLKAPLQNKLQAWATKLSKAKKAEAAGKAGTDTVKGLYYPFLDRAYGEDTYVVYQARAPFENMRMTRQMQEPREFDVELLRAKLTPAQFAAITKTRVDVDALDSALARKEVPDAIISEATTYLRKANLLWTPAGARSAFHLEPGQVAVLSSGSTDQEG